MAKKNGRSRVVKPRSRQQTFTKLRSLKCFKEVHSRLVAGWPIPEIVKFVQDVQHEYTDVTRTGLISVLKLYKKTIPAAELAERVASPLVMKAVHAVEEGIDELDEMQKLYKLQMERIQIDFNNEKSIKKLLPTMTQEVRVAREILNTYASLKMDLGLSKRHIGQLDIDARIVADTASRYEGESVGKVLDNPESRRKVLSMAQRLLESSEVLELLESEPEVIDAEAEVVE